MSDNSQKIEVRVDKITNRNWGFFTLYRIKDTPFYKSDPEAFQLTVQSKEVRSKRRELIYDFCGDYKVWAASNWFLDIDENRHHEKLTISFQDEPSDEFIQELHTFLCVYHPYEIAFEKGKVRVIWEHTSVREYIQAFTTDVTDERYRLAITPISDITVPTLEETEKFMATLER